MRRAIGSPFRLASQTRFTSTARTTARSSARPSSIARTTGIRMLHATAPTAIKQPFKLGDIGEGIAEVEVIQWFVKPPCTIEEFDPIVEVSSDKATVEITSPFSGRILATHGQVGEIVKVGDVLCDIDVPDALASDEAPSSTSPDAQPSTSADAGSLPMQVAAATPTESELSGPAPDVGQASAPSPSGKLAGPATRFLAKQHGIDISQLAGTGPQGASLSANLLTLTGRVLKGDVLAAVQARDQPAPVPEPARAASAAPTEAQRIPLEPHRKNMFKAMTASQAMVPFGYADEIDVTQLERIRGLLNANIPLRYRSTLPRGVNESSIAGRVDQDGRFDRITLLPLLLKALSHALHEHPLFASQLVDAGTPEMALLRRPSHDVSIALSAPDTNALYTPLLAGVDKSSPFELASRIARLQRTPDFRFSPATLKGGTITLSNVGVVGGTYTSPVIPPTGQLAIGALGRTRVVPVYTVEQQALAKAAALDSTIEPPIPIPRLLMTASFTADHRIVAGVELAQLVATWKALVEQPERLVGFGA